jgi:hypothetical protein
MLVTMVTKLHISHEDTLWYKDMVIISPTKKDTGSRQSSPPGRQAGCTQHWSIVHAHTAMGVGLTVGKGRAQASWFTNANKRVSYSVLDRAMELLNFLTASNGNCDLTSSDASLKNEAYFLHHFWLHHCGGVAGLAHQWNPRSYVSLDRCW